MRILIIKLSSLGDVIHCLPTLAVLKSGFPEAMIDWLVEEQNAGILEGHTHIDNLIVLPRKSWMKKPWHIKKIYSEIKIFMRDLRAREYDLIIDFQGLFRSGLLVALSRGKRKIGFDRVREMAHIFYNERVPLSTLNQHAITRYMEITNYLKVTPSNFLFSLPISEKEAEEANKLLEENGIKTHNNNKLVYINPNARWSSKIWPWERFKELIKELSLRGYEVVLIGGPNDKDKMDMAFRGLGDKIYNLAGQTSLKSLAAILKRGDCLITNDSGPMHLAVAVGLPVIALFGPSNPLRTGPFGWQNEDKRNKVLFSPISCAPCYKRECTRKKCLMNISVDQVLSALEELLILEPL